MNYEKLYFAFIEKWKKQVINKGVYTESHHIVPRHAGGGDEPENLVRLEYRQHVFAHKLLWKAYGRLEDHYAYVMMSGQDGEKKREVLSAIGRRNVESGHLDRIRPLANNSAQRAWARELGRKHVESGFLDKIRPLSGRKVWTQEKRDKRSILYKEAYSAPEKREILDAMRDTAIGVNIAKSKELAASVLENAERNEEYLHMRSSRSKNLFISPEGLKFESPIYAAKYYGNIQHYTIENWCKREMHGWCRKPKAPQE